LASGPFFTVFQIAGISFESLIGFGPLSECFSFGTISNSLIGFGPMSKCVQAIMRSHLASSFLPEDNDVTGTYQVNVCRVRFLKKEVFLPNLL